MKIKRYAENSWKTTRRMQLVKIKGLKTRLKTRRIIADYPNGLSRTNFRYLMREIFSFTHNIALVN